MKIEKHHKNNIYKNDCAPGKRLILDKGLPNERMVTVISPEILFATVKDDHGNTWSVAKCRLSKS